MHYDNSRRAFVLAGLAGLAGSAGAQPAYPSRPVRLVVPFPPGGAADAMARAVAARLAEKLGQPFVVDNRAGAGGNVGTEQVAKAPADGYTLVLAAAGAMAISPALYPRLPYDPQRDFSFIGQIASFQGVLAVGAEQPFKTLRDLVAHARANPGRLSYGSPGNGTTPHLAAELLKKAAGIDMTHIPYRGDAPAISEAIGGQVPVAFINIAPAVSVIQSGRLRALAVSGAGRSPLLPGVPTVAESGHPGYSVVGWAGLAAPVGTPAPVIARLAGTLKTVLAGPDLADQLAAQSAEPTYRSSGAFTAYAQAERLRFAQLVREARITLD